MTGRTPAPSNRTSRRRRGGVVVPHQPTRLQRLLARLVFLLIRAVALTLRRSLVDCTGCHDPLPPRAIYAVWHNRLALCLEAYRTYARPRSAARGLAALVSASRDGGFLAAVLECYGVRPVRGSSSRRGPQALLELTTWAERGYDLAITPDGPRGPRYVVQDGVISLAQVTGLPIVPASYRLSRFLRLRSWDGFIVPLPFARWEVILGKPLHVPRQVSETEREEFRRELQRRLLEITHD